ncbi:MAG: ABC transporter, partial [Microbacteriaceae bacterium]|nr:ABC transporter [Microbacteriaceae bacterium]
MSLINATVDSAIAIAERRRGKLGAALYSGRGRSVIMRNVYALKSSTWLVVLSGFVEPVFYLLAFGVGLGGIIG